MYSAFGNLVTCNRCSVKLIAQPYIAEPLTCRTFFQRQSIASAAANLPRESTHSKLLANSIKFTAVAFTPVANVGALVPVWPTLAQAPGPQPIPSVPVHTNPYFAIRAGQSMEGRCNSAHRRILRSRFISYRLSNCN